ncbi:hypothetical protein EZV62_000915 [Acer yangbiense]|uniref:Splicing factor subunit n=1 Tax=Acer yangbiense TaxID=1000413 RepID=A0A5C7IV26_9ROSI|nr:hypothetical protein EZV62_000915 [Acer yangbiense]
MRLQMHKMSADEFEPLTMIGKGVFRENRDGDGSLRLTTPPPPPSAPGHRPPSAAFSTTTRLLHVAENEEALTIDNVQASDRFNINSQLEHLQAKYVGTGHADLNRFEWAVNIQRDSFASYIGHYPMLAYFAIAENESIGRERYNFMQKMLLPCGLPPEREDD